MKFSLTPGPRRPLDRQTAWGCLTANLVGVPGIGSLAAGRRTGYLQMALALGGFALTSIYAVRFIIWYSAHSAEFTQLDEQMGTHFGELWEHLRWAFLGMGVFLLGWLWALASGLSIVAEARANGPKPLPPHIKP